MKENIIELIKKHKLIAIIRGVDSEDLVPLCQALYDGGVRLAEVTFTAGGSKDEETAKNIGLLAEKFEGKLSVGAGTVTTERQVELTYEAGGQFIISPNTVEAVIRKTTELGLVSIPGALTPSEIYEAHSFGADFVKLFPAGNLGTSYIKAVAAPLSNIPLLAVGGVDLDNIREYMKTGICGVGIGTNIIRKSLIKAKDFDTIINLAKEYTECLKNF